MAGLTTTAQKSKDGKSWVINGEKKWITQGERATHALCAARTGPPGAKGLTVFILDMNAEGIERRKMYNSGVNSSGSTYIELNDVVVPSENILGKENQGFEIIMSSKFFPFSMTPRIISITERDKRITSLHTRASLDWYYCLTPWSSSSGRQLSTCSSTRDVRKEVV